MAIHRWILGVLLGCMVAAPGSALFAADAPAATPAAGAAASVTVTVGDGGRFSLVAANADIGQVLAALSKEAGWQIQLAPAVQRPITLTLSDETFENILGVLARSINYLPTRVYAVLPKKEGRTSPDPFKLPIGLPNVTLETAGAVPAAVFVALHDKGIEVQTPEELKGQINLQVQDSPLPEVLDNICRQIDAIWMLSYRLVPAPTAATGGRPPVRGGAPALAGAQGDPDQATAQEMQQWSQLSPEQRQKLARKQIADILRSPPAQRKQQADALAGQLYRLARAVGRLPAEQRAKVAPMVADRAGPYVQELQRLTPDQQRDFQSVMGGAQRLMRMFQAPKR